MIIIFFVFQDFGPGHPGNGLRRPGKRASERLVRPVVFVLRRGLHDEAEWTAWVAGIESPAPLSSWAEALGSEAGLARRHNLRLFLLALHAALRESGDPALEARLPPVRAALSSVP